MNIKKIIYLILFLCILVGLTYYVFSAKREKLSMEKEQCIYSARQFITWYKNNSETISSVQGAMVGEDSKGYYVAEPNKIDEYISLLKQSGYFSNEFLSNFKEHLLESGNKLASLKQNDGPAIGFTDGDFFWGQEFRDYYLPLMPDRISIKVLQDEPNKKVLLLADYQEYNFNNNCVITSTSKK